MRFIKKIFIWSGYKSPFRDSFYLLYEKFLTTPAANMFDHCITPAYFKCIVLKREQSSSILDRFDRWISIIKFIIIINT